MFTQVYLAVSVLVESLRIIIKKGAEKKIIEVSMLMLSVKIHYRLNIIAQLY